MRDELPIVTYQQRIKQALSGDNLDQKRIAIVGLRWLNTLLNKNADYGSSAWQPPPLKPGMDPGDAILVRMSDKVQRIANLTSGNSPQVAESLNDSVEDLGAYCLLWLAKPKPRPTPHHDEDDLDDDSFDK